METAFDFVKRYHPEGIKHNDVILLGLLEGITDKTDADDSRKLLGVKVLGNEDKLEKTAARIRRQVLEEAIESYQKNHSGEKEDMQHAWGFVQKYYPDYDHADQIAWADDMQKLVDNEFEEDDAACNTLHREYDGDINNPQILHDYNEMHIDIYERSIKAFIEQR